jgi:hypothetical protein
MQQQAVRSRVNCPERLSLTSDDDVANPNNPYFSQFQINLATPVLDPQRCQLIRATVPAVQLQLPDWGGLCFWFWKLPTATTVPESQYLKCVRLYPSWYVPPSGFTAYTKNRFVNDPSDLVTLLNQAAGAGGDDVNYNAYWSSAEVTFSYSATTKQITFVGNSSGSFYAPAGYNDAIVLTIINGTAGTRPVMPNATATGSPLTPTTAQPQVSEYTLNLRVGYAMSGVARGQQSFGAGQTAYADVTNVAYAYNVAVPADSYPNLVYTNNVYMYANFMAGASLTSNNRHNLLACCPFTVGPFGVNQYVAATSNLLTKLSQTIQNIVIELRDDADQPYSLPDNAQVSLEVSFSYQNKNF